MSADNWTHCPRCVAVIGAGLEALEAKVDKSYGKVPIGEFDRMRAELAARKAEPIEKTFREDWELGVDGDEFSVSYNGHCSVCGLKHKFEHVETIELVDND